MKKLSRLMVLVTAFAFLLAMAGCALFTGSSADAGKTITGDIAFTDTFTYSDPEGLEFDTRYVLYDASGSSLSSYEYYGCTATNEYTLLYAKDDVLVCQAVVIIFQDAKDAEKYAAAADPTGESSVCTDNVVYYSVGEETLAPMLTIYKSSGYISEETASAMVKFYKDAGMSEYTAE